MHYLQLVNLIFTNEVFQVNDVLVFEPSQYFDFSQGALAECLVLERSDLFDSHLVARHGVGGGHHDPVGSGAEVLQRVVPGADLEGVATNCLLDAGSQGNLIQFETFLPRTNLAYRNIYNWLFPSFHCVKLEGVNLNEV